MSRRLHFAGRWSLPLVFVFSSSEFLSAVRAQKSGGGEKKMFDTATASIIVMVVAFIVAIIIALCKLSVLYIAQSMEVAEIVQEIKAAEEKKEEEPPPAAEEEEGEGEGEGEKAEEEPPDE